jgi:putative membrane protein
MKTLLRYFLINLTALFVTTQAIAGLSYGGELKTLLIGGFVFTIINLILVPFLKILLLPLNLLTLGLFAWLTNVIALYALTTVVSGFKLGPYFFSGFIYNGFKIPPLEFSTFWAAVAASFLIGAITHFLQWLSH